MDKKVIFLAICVLKSTGELIRKRYTRHFIACFKTKQMNFLIMTSEFGHLEGDTIVGKDHKSAVMTLAERVSKLIIALKLAETTAAAVEQRLDQWFTKLPRNLFKSITFDCGETFFNLGDFSFGVARFSN
ncbi:IS30 family transposase [Treponema phagedenis]|nr:IS30 family transposase [Treponema phagedenis]